MAGPAQCGLPDPPCGVSHMSPGTSPRRLAIGRQEGPCRRRGHGPKLAESRLAADRGRTRPIETSGLGVAPDAVGGETHARHRLAARGQALRVLGQIADEDHPVDHVRLLDWGLMLAAPPLSFWAD